MSKMKIPAKMTASWLAREIRANVDAMYSGAKAYEEFDRDARWLWDRSRTAGLDAAVSKILRTGQTRNPSSDPHVHGRHIAIHWEGGQTTHTTINGTRKDIRAYFVGKMFNFGLGGQDHMIKALSVEFLDAPPARNPSSGAKQRARGTRVATSVNEGHHSEGAHWEQNMRYAATDRRRARKMPRSTIDEDMNRDEVIYGAKQLIGYASGHRPKLPNPSGAKQRARGTRTFRPGRTPDGEFHAAGTRQMEGSRAEAAWFRKATPAEKHEAERSYHVFGWPHETHHQGKTFAESHRPKLPNPGGVYLGAMQPRVEVATSADRAFAKIPAHFGLDGFWMMANDRPMSKIMAWAEDHRDQLRPTPSTRMAWCIPPPDGGHGRGNKRWIFIF